MYLFPNGQNIQLLAARAPSVPVNTGSAASAKKPEPAMLQVLKDVAPHLNRQQRRAKLSELKTKAKSEAKALAEKETAKQKKEKDRV